jgi:hypothetical protein
MSMLKSSLRSVTLLGSLALAACGGDYYHDAYIAPPPPAPYTVAAVGYAPGPGYVWTGGYWDLRGGRWLWAEGAWVRPPHHRAVWVRPYWEPRGRSYRFHHGYWR